MAGLVPAISLVHDHGEPDLDLVEKAFVTGFADAPDPTSFLRLARIPFEAHATDSTRLVLLRVETDLVTDIGAVMSRRRLVPLRSPPRRLGGAPPPPALRLFRRARFAAAEPRRGQEFAGGVAGANLAVVRKNGNLL